jgi:hypothetical protein
MNSDPNDTAAWRAFGMLDSDETAGFDEAAHRDPALRAAYQEMERLTAAIAVTSVAPVQPRSGQLHKLHKRLGLDVRRPLNWVGITGWAAAAALAVMLVIGKPPPTGDTIVRLDPPPVAPVIAVQETSPELPASPATGEAPDDTVADSTSAATAAVVKFPIKAETKRLIQQIEVLREKLEGLEERDRERFDPVPGKSWPVVMRMAPPGAESDPAEALAIHKGAPAMTAMLGDALLAGNGKSGPIISDFFMPPVDPSAIPIYDAARDTGTLVVSNLPAIQPGENFNLWVRTRKDGAPIHVGSLPESSPGASDTFDFNLGSPGIVPLEFLLTQDPAGKVAKPTQGNTVLMGPK